MGYHTEADQAHLETVKDQSHQADVHTQGLHFQAYNWRHFPDGHRITDVWTAEEDIREKHWSDIREGEIVLDVGAGFGLYSLPACHQGAKVFAFEPTAQREILRASFKMNPSHTWLILPFVLWDGETEFPAELLPEMFSRYPEEPLNLRTLDDVVFGIPLPRVDRIKIDVEAAEVGVLKGARRTLETFHPKLLIEDHAGCYDYADRNDTSGQVRTILSALGYRISEIEIPGRRRDGRPGIMLVAEAGT
jgi:FkbM family methyltransferase